jgi:hypothetical protein
MNTIIITSIMELAVLLADPQLVDCANVWGAVRDRVIIH